MNGSRVLVAVLTGLASGPDLAPAALGLGGLISLRLHDHAAAVGRSLAAARLALDEPAARPRMNPPTAPAIDYDGDAGGGSTA